ncbi:MAG: tetratricopeptide repeat protein [Chitinophagaceae bacterium]|nr:tetratricopeptide repeat protein [Chitinophagaceae bacterium]
MKLLLKILLLLFLPSFTKAQTLRQIDSLRFILQHAANDTVRMGVCSALGGWYDDISVDSGLYYCHKGIALAEKLDLQLNKALTLAYMSWPLMKTGNYPEALKVLNQGFKIAEDPSNEKKAGYLKKGQSLPMFRLYVIGILYAARESLYGYVGDYEKQIAATREAIPYAEAAEDIFNLAGLYPDLGDCYLKLNKFDSALYYQKKSLDYYPKLSFEDRKFEGSTYTSIGTIYEKMGHTNLAGQNYLKAIQLSELHENFRHVGNACLQLANLYQSLNNADSSFLYAKKALAAFSQGGYKKEVAITYRMISDYYWENKNTDSSFAYLRRATKLADSLDKIEKPKLQEFQVSAFHQQLDLQQQEQVRIEQEGKQKTIAIIFLVVVFSIIGFLLYRNNRQKQKANHLLQQKNTLIEQTLNDLKATQKQLIQSEKMASLGELTAGIAHEIQNPLNFVNNFSELNQELANELDSELAIGNTQLAKDLVTDIKTNSKKINQHGLRASSIVKGMLEHSRKSSGVKEPTDINKLCEEFIRLSYHGLRANDPQDTAHNSFNCEYKLDLDPKLPLVNVVSQDIGRVLLNVVNNAFQACKEKFERLKSESQKDYKPFVIVSTKYIASLPAGEAGRCEICISDNGPGIPDSIKDKIFQPFFTTKPTGQGTGLGLSLSYDIVKAHGGELKVETKESRPDDPRLNDTVGQAVGRGEGCQFIIQLPINQN